MSKTGVCIFFDDAKGFGFISQDDGGEDLFVHRNHIVDGQNLVRNDALCYDRTWDDRKGKSHAINVTGGTGGESCVFSGGKGSGGGGFGDGKGNIDGGKGFGGGGFDGAGKRGSKGEDSESDVCNTIFIRGLPFSTAEESLKYDFAICGKIVSLRMPLSFGGTCKGIAFIEYASRAGMENALTFNESDYGGRTIFVSDAADKPNTALADNSL